MFNTLFVLIVFLLQLNKDKLHVDWPLGVKTNITYNGETSKVWSIFKILGGSHRKKGLQRFCLFVFIPKTVN